ncbi:MAG TPA: hypothetical protein VII07_05525 [Bradyrhizobium sp.]
MTLLVEALSMKSVPSVISTAATIASTQRPRSALSSSASHL